MSDDRSTPDVIAREGEPHDDDLCVHRMEIEFAIPVYFPPGALRELDGLLSSVVRMKMNQLRGHAHWVSGYGSKPMWSQMDAAFLGKTPADDAPLRGEPSFDDSVYHIETSCIERIVYLCELPNCKGHSKKQESCAHD